MALSQKWTWASDKYSYHCANPTPPLSGKAKHNPLLTSPMTMVLSHPKNMNSLWNFNTKIVCVDKGGIMIIQPTNHSEEVTKTLCCWCYHQSYRLFLRSLHSGGTTDKMDLTKWKIVSRDQIKSCTRSLLHRKYHSVMPYECSRVFFIYFFSFYFF